MLSSRSRTKCVLAFLIGLSSAMLWISSTSQRFASRTSSVFKGVAANSGGEELKGSANCAQQSALAGVDPTTRGRLLDAYGKLPLSFEANEGQVDSRVKFMSRAGGQTLFLTSTEAVLMLRSPGRPRQTQDPMLASGFERRPAATVESKGAALRMNLVGANPAAKVIGLDELPGKSQYFIGNDPKKWHTGVSNYTRVRYHSVYRGIDLVYYGNQCQLEYDFIVAPGADPKPIKLAFKGAETMRVDQAGDLVLTTAVGETRHRRPVAYQIVNGAKKEVAGRYVIDPSRQVRVELEPYDRSKSLVIDPVLSYSTYLGGGGADVGVDIAVDVSGNAYVIGDTGSVNFPTNDPLQPSLAGSTDVFLTKLDAAGSGLIYSTYLGGLGNDRAGGVALDSAGNAYVIGYTDSSNFPTANAIQPILHGPQDVFITKLNPTASALVYSSYLGGDGQEWGFAVAVDSAGSAYLSGTTFSTDFPTANAIQMTSSGPLAGDAFVAKLNPSGSALLYSTYLGGYGEEAGEGIAVDSGGNAYVTGYTRSPNFPTANPLQPTFGGPCFKTNDGGGVWSSIGNGFASFAAQCLAIDPTTPAIVYAAGARGTGIFKTTNNGNSWAAINNGVNTDLQVNAIVVDPANPSTLYAATFDAVIKSTNAGASWVFSGAGLSINTVLSLAIDPEASSTLYAGMRPNSSGSSVFMSKNGGASWAPIGNGIPSSPVFSLVIDPTNSKTLFAGSQSRVYRSTDAGSSWTAVFFSFSNVTPLAIDPANPATIYVGASPGVYKSTNGGTNWSITALGSVSINSLAIDTLNSATVYAGSFSGVFKTTNAGGSWSAMNSGLGVPNIKALVIDRADSSALYAGTSCLTDAFVTKLNPSGSAFVYSTYLGGSFDDEAFGIAVDSAGNAYVTGLAISSDFPTVNALQPAFGGDVDAFITKINASGSALIYSTYLGGLKTDEGISIALDTSRNAYIAGFTQSTNFPTSSPFQSNLAGSEDVFVAKLNETGSLLIYSTYLGGNGSERASGISVDPVGSAYIAGFTTSTSFPTTPGAFQINFAGGSNDSFVAKIGSPCVYSLSRTSQVFPTSGGSGSVDLTTAVGCGWTAVASDNWITIVSADSGIGSANLAFEVRENFAESFRIGTLTIAGQTFTVLQEGLGSSECSNSISPTFSSFPSVGGSSSVNVSASEGCIWRAVSNTSWVTITSNDNGIGVGVVTYSVGANAGAASRKGTITIAGQTFAIKQKGSAASGGSGGGKP